jgi:hypothetical protein
MATVNFYREMQKALLGAQPKIKVQPISSAPGTSWQVAERLLRKAVEEWEAGRKEQRDKDDLAQAMKMARAYNAPRPDYDPDEFGTDPRQIRMGADKLDAYQESLGETPTPFGGIDPNTGLTIADPGLKGPLTYEPGDEPKGDLEAQRQSLIADAARQQRSFETENPIGMARVDRDFGDVKGLVSQKMLLALMGDENRRAAEKLKRSRELSDTAADRAFRAGESDKTRAAADARHKAATRQRLEYFGETQKALQRRVSDERKYKSDEERRKEAILKVAADKKKQLQLQSTAVTQSIMEKALDGAFASLDAAKKDPLSLGASGTFSQIPAMLSGSHAGKLRSHILTLKSPIVMGGIEALRKSSAAGATGFGAMNKEELGILIYRLGALDPDTTDSSILRSTLEGIREQVEVVKKDVLANVPHAKLRAIGLGDWIPEKVSQMTQSAINNGVIQAVWDAMTDKQRKLFP